jgi:uroporphyrin-III C-methyltransferase/precorrin-2 dehydrogenase/sirohydrochlorin ferrochelatase
MTSTCFDKHAVKDLAMHSFSESPIGGAPTEKSYFQMLFGRGGRLRLGLIDAALIFRDKVRQPAGVRGSRGTQLADTGSPAVGRVTLVGAGPGDPELLTLKAIRAIQSADVILFDALVSREILDLAGADSQLIPVGKRGGRPSCRQKDINELMVTFADQGKRVVRLKAGDPVIFGRAGEEIEHLRAAGVEVNVVPGITAASAMAASFGISLTHRDHAKSVRFVTGHSKSGGLPSDLDWKAVADPSSTTVFYMGGRMAGEIAARLIEMGMPSSTYVGVAVSVSRSNERRGYCTLETLVAFLDSVGFSEPVVIGVGPVFSGARVSSGQGVLIHQDLQGQRSL